MLQYTYIIYNCLLVSTFTSESEVELVPFTLPTLKIIIVLIFRLHILSTTANSVRQFPQSSNMI